MEFLKLIDENRNEIIRTTQEAIRIKSVEEKPLPGMPFGEGPYRALEFVLNIGESMGFSTKNFEGYAGHIDFGEGEEILGILAHVDVVPEGEGWLYPPYGGEIHNDKIYGRGAIDDKGPAIATLYAMKALKEAGINLKKKVRLILGANEETGWGCMDYYFKHEKAPDMGFTPDSDFPVIHGEKGIINFDLIYKFDEKTNNDIYIKDIKGGNAPNMVPDNAEAILECKDFEKIDDIYIDYKNKKDYPISIFKEDEHIRIVAKGKSAHGSTPEKGLNAISYLMDFLNYIIDKENPLYEFIKFYNERIAFKHNGEGIGAGLEDDISGKLNFNPGLLKLENGSIVLTINVRYPIKSSSKEVYEGIRENLKDSKVELVEGISDSKPLYVPSDDFLVEKLMNVYREQTGDYTSMPITIGGGTYARAIKNAVAFGPMFPGQIDVAHQKNEYISIDHLMQITKIYAHAIYELAK
ncbi:dipeptidase PepV [Tissierella sp. Yu-01]|uniref:dipeptidase PepV n=1 Tax=Tissierella sp. Yu-01 TaxID=3035694 RepID=UPI00240CEB52|nr:dipeptidase PepV [Tissierella sp. Yu-01]WFA09885.1 dipeptidase PepV [Tissierella sp. Yu-01]